MIIKDFAWCVLISVYYPKSLSFESVLIGQRNQSILQISKQEIEKYLSSYSEDMALIFNLDSQKQNSLKQ